MLRLECVQFNWKVDRENADSKITGLLSNVGEFQVGQTRVSHTASGPEPSLLPVVTCRMR